MKNIKHLFAALLLLLSVKISASDDTTLVLEMRDGSTANFLLVEKPTITFTGEFVKIVSEFCSAEFTRSCVRKYHFCDQTPNAVTETLLKSTVAFDDNILVISDVPENTVIKIYTVSGVLAKSLTVIDGNCSVSLDELITGTYVVSFNNTTFKFLKK